MISIAILGYGIVGSGVVEVLEKNKEIIFNNTNREIDLKYILELKEFKGEPIEKLITNNFNTILEDDSIKIVIEVMGGIDISYKFIKEILLKGKHVVTSNKDLVAKHGTELLKIAKENNINFLFEASVAGSIPILRNTQTTLLSDDILEIKGIMNGTTNYILTNMMKNNESFDVALKKAQELGYAEKDPREDIEGFDTGRKIAILISLITGKFVNYKDFHIEGIVDVSPIDIEFAKSIDGTIKLIAHGKKVKDGFAINVAPKIISNHSLMSNVDYAFNAISINGSCSEELIFYGKGAGKLPTATAVLSDVIDIINNIDKNIGYNWTDDKEALYSYEDLETNYLVRTSYNNKNIDRNIIKNIFQIDDLEFIENNKFINQFAFIINDISKKDLDSKINTLKEQNINVLSKYTLER